MTVAILIVVSIAALASCLRLWLSWRKGWPW